MGYNGLYGLLPRQYVAAEFLERVEVFRGANSFLNGAAPGGSGIGGSFGASYLVLGGPRTFVISASLISNRHQVAEGSSA